MRTLTFEKPVVFMPRANLLQRICSVPEASYFLLHRWPEPKGPAYLAAREACYRTVLGQMSVEDCRRAFDRALNEAKMPRFDGLGETEGAERIEDGPSFWLALARPRPCARAKIGLSEEPAGWTRQKGRVRSGAGTKASARHFERLSSNPDVSAVACSVGWQPAYGTGLSPKPGSEVHLSKRRVMHREIGNENVGPL